MSVRKIRKKYRMFLITIILLFTIFFVIIPAVFYFLPFSIFFAFHAFIVGWWILPITLGYAPFFYENLMYRIRLLPLLSFLLIFPLGILLLLGALDEASGLGISNALLGGFSAVLSTPILPYLVLILSSYIGRYFLQLRKKIEVIPAKSWCKAVPIVGVHRSFHYDQEKWVKKGPPVAIKNGTDHPLEVGEILFEFYTLHNLPISFFKKHCIRPTSPIYNECSVHLPELQIIQPGESTIIHLPWTKLNNVITMLAQEYQKSRGRLRSYISIYDEFSGKEYRSDELIHPVHLLGELSYPSTVKIFEEIGKG